MLAFLYAPALLLIYYLVVWFLHGRDPKPGPVVPRYTPPPGLTPAAARYLQLNGTDGRSLAALLVDLALRKRITIEPQFTVSRPLVTTATEVMTTGEGETMEAATQRAIEAMADLMKDTLGVDDTDAAMLIAGAADVRTGIAGHPPYTIRVAVPTSVLTL